MKLHLGCGPVYLEGYVNIDSGDFQNHYFAPDWPGLVERNKTTIHKYYKRPVTRADIEAGLNFKEPVVCDLFSNHYSALPFEPGTIDEIRLVQVFEHFTYRQGEQLIAYWHTLLKPGGVLHLDVPDLYETAHLYTRCVSLEDKKWYARLLFGSQKNEYGLHRSMYDRQILADALLRNGFKNIEFLPNIHFYPAFAIEATK